MDEAHHRSAHEKQLGALLARSKSFIQKRKSSFDHRRVEVISRHAGYITSGRLPSNGEIAPLTPRNSFAKPRGCANSSLPL